MLALSSIDDAVALAIVLPDLLPSLRSLELVLDAGMELVCDQAGLARPFPTRYPCYVIVEVGRPIGRRRRALTSALARPDRGRRRPHRARHRAVDDLLAYRERQAEAISRVGIAHKYDVALPLGRPRGVPRRTGWRALAELDGVRCVTFGHLAEGNLHVNVLVPPTADLGVELEIDELVLGRVLELGGTISAEHGIGIAKAAWLERMRGRDDVATMRAIKDALRPERHHQPGRAVPRNGR